MSLEVAKFNTVQEGLKELGDSAYSMRQNLEARLDDQGLFSTWLDSKTIQLYGGVNEDNRHRFKIDHAFDLSAIINEDISSDGSIKINQGNYLQSQGTEFIIISKSELKEAEADYAIRADNCQSIREQLNNGNYKLQDLEKAGGFKINVHLTPGEAKSHNGWKELAAGKNKASSEDYASASELLCKYIGEAKKEKCFPDGIGMGFFVETSVKSYKARPWYVFYSGNRSDADGRGYFDSIGRFLRVCKEVAEGDDAQEIIPYESALAEARRLAPDSTPFNPILVGLVNTIYRKK
jgi:hypothetical protein